MRVKAASLRLIDGHVERARRPAGQRIVDGGGDLLDGGGGAHLEVGDGLPRGPVGAHQAGARVEQHHRRGGGVHDGVAQRQRGVQRRAVGAAFGGGPSSGLQIAAAAEQRQRPPPLALAMHERGDRRHEQQRKHDREVLHAVSLTAPVDMLSAMRIGLPDGTDLELENGATGLDVANAIGPRLARAAVAVGVGDDVRDLRLPLAEGDRVRILTARDAEALPVLRHSTAHVMAEAVLHLWPDAKVAIGPAIADGFYYDFQFPEPISSDDLGRIEQEMRRILAQEHPFVRTDGVDKAEILARFEAEAQPYKLELARDLPDGEISLYTQDGFEDLCRGPHLQTHEADQGLQAAVDGRAPTGAATPTTRC